MTLHEVLNHGPILAHDDEIDLLIIFNNARFMAWGGNQKGNYLNYRNFPIYRDRGALASLHSVSAGELIAEAKRLANELKTDFYEGEGVSARYQMGDDQC